MIMLFRQDIAVQGIWIQDTTLTSDQTRVLTVQSTILTIVKNDANNLQ